MADYPGAPDVTVNQIDFNNTVGLIVAPNNTLNLHVHYDASSWGQAMLLHKIIDGARPQLFDPAVYQPSGSLDCHDLQIGGLGAYVISAWVWWGNDIHDNPGPNQWRQVPIRGTAPTGKRGSVSFVGGNAPNQAPGPAGNATVSWIID